MAANKQHSKETFSDFMFYQCMSMQLTAIFPKNRSFSYLSQRVAHILQRAYFVLIFASTFHITCMLIITLYQTMEQGFEESVYFLSQLIVYTLMPSQLVYFQIRAQKCYDLIDYMNAHFVRRSARGLTYVTAYRCYRWGKVFTFLYVGFALTACLQYLIVPIMSAERTLLINCWYPFDPLQTPIYQALLCIQTLSQAIIAIMFSNSLVFSLGVSMTICVQFKIWFCNLKNLEHTFVLQQGRQMTAKQAQHLRSLQLQLHIDANTFPFSVERLDDLSDLPLHTDTGDVEAGEHTETPPSTFSWDDSHGINRLVHACVRHHRHLVHCSLELESIIHPILLCKFVVVTVQLCVLALNVLRVPHTTAEIMNEFLYLIAVMGDTFYNAHSGQILLDQSVRVLDFLYSIPWYRMDRALRRDMLFIQLFSRRPLKLTGGKFFVMDYQKFVAMIKLSFSYFTLLEK